MPDQGRHIAKRSIDRVVSGVRKTLNLLTQSISALNKLKGKSQERGIKHKINFIQTGQVLTANK